MQSPMVPLNVPLGDGRGAGTVVVSIPEHPPDYAVWSICNFIYGNPCCLGLVALIFSMKSRDRKMVGDMTGATMYGSKACCLNIIALVLIIISIIITIVVIAATRSSYSSYYSRDRKMVGDMTGAKLFGSQVFYFNGCALAFIIILAKIFTVVISSQLASVPDVYRRYNK